MATLDTKDATGAKAGTVELDDAMFGIEPNVPVMHQVVTAQLAARRSGTQSTKTRAEVRGGGAKPWKQKGTGRARAGSSRSPIWTGGGVAHAPKPRSYAQRTPKKMIRLALRSALSDRAASERILVIDWGIDTPSTKAAVDILARNGVTGRVLAVLRNQDDVVWKSLRNLPQVHICSAGELNAYDVLVSDWLIFTPDTLPVDRPVKRGQPVAQEVSS
ncbi:MAG: 50S ribosomal protein L4 [Acidimicrobiales bacterium]|nr:50S ribosomal protein L4 [Acidimicrobiales bacterium]